MKRLLLVALLVASALPARSEMLGDASFEGIALSAGGSPAVRRGGIFFPLAVGGYCLPGDRIQLAHGDRLKVLLRTGRVLDLAGPRTLQLSEEFGDETWFAPLVRDVLGERFGLFDSDLGRGPDIATNALRQISPFNSSVMTAVPELRWKAPDGLDRFTVEVFQEDIIGNTSARICGVDVARVTHWLPSGDVVTFAPGQTYSWSLRGFDGRGWQASGKAFFRILDAETVGRIKSKLVLLEDMKKKDRDDIMPWVIGAILLMKEKLYHQALDHVAQAISRNDRAPFPYTLRGRIYEEMNLPHLAAGDYYVAQRLGSQ